MAMTGRGWEGFPLSTTLFSTPGCCPIPKTPRQSRGSPRDVLRWRLTARFHLHAAAELMFVFMQIEIPRVRKTKPTPCSSSRYVKTGSWMLLGQFSVQTQSENQRKPSQKPEKTSSCQGTSTFILAFGAVFSTKVMHAPSQGTFTCKNCWKQTKPKARSTLQKGTNQSDCERRTQQ